MERYATQNQINYLKDLLTEYKLYDGHYDRLWKLLEVHEIDVRAPGDGTRMLFITASQSINWVKRQISKLPAAQRRELPDVPAGHYAVESATGSNDLDFYRVDRPGSGQWAGRTFIKRVIGGRPSVRVTGLQARRALEAIEAASPAAAGQLYGQELGRCCRCNRHLTDQLSRELGIGPECRSKKQDGGSGRA